MICGAFKRPPKRPESVESAYRSIRLRPSALNRCSFSRGATARMRWPMAGALVPGIRTITSPGGSSPGLALTVGASPASERMP